MRDDPRQPRSRRSVLSTAAGAFALTGGAVALWPLVSSLSPNAGSPRDTLEVDLATIAEGTWREVPWHGLPIVVRHRTPQEIGDAQGVALTDLRDGLARVAGERAGLPATDANRTKPGQARWLVVSGICPRSSCRIEARRPDFDGIDKGIAWLCPCDGCRFDTAGRIRTGLSLENLAVPPYRFIAPTRIEIGTA